MDASCSAIALFSSLLHIAYAIAAPAAAPKSVPANVFVDISILESPNIDDVELPAVILLCKVDRTVLADTSVGTRF
jgi:hypothetical protein